MWIRRSLELAGAALLLGSAAVASADDAATQRARIERERAAIEARARAGERECAQRFAVSSCLARVREERREGLQRLDQQQALLDDAQRKRRAAERQARIMQRQQAQARADEQRLPPPSSRPVREALMPTPDGAQTEAVPATRPRASAAAAREAAEAARRAEASQRRAKEVEAHRAAVERRNRERAARKPPAASLPVPAASSPAH
jgi:hypothetical protein